MASRWRTAAALSAAVLACVVHPLQAQKKGGLRADQGKLLATGGMTMVEGAGGGALAPWALITGYGTNHSWGANAHFTFIGTPDFWITGSGAGVGVLDRFEFSYTRMELKGTDSPASAAASLAGINISQDIVGGKLRLVGDAVYDQNSWLPQLAVGALYHHHAGIHGAPPPLDAVDEPTDIGAVRNSGVDFYLAATKLYLKRSLLLNVTGRLSRANQFGLLGFGGPNSDKYKLAIEGAAAMLFSKKLAIGGEYRSKPRNLAVDAEDDAFDFGAFWFPTKNVSVVVAYVYLGNILTPATQNENTQHGPYLSFSAGF
jgi:hypothetical protein